MTEQERSLIIQRAKDFFKNEIVKSHITDALTRASKLSDYNIQPFLLKYLANFLTGDSSPESIAKALLYPRILGTSINTIFGMRAQKMISKLFDGLPEFNAAGSSSTGMDIVFIDGIDGRQKYCQLKAGPNTINKDDVKTILDHFKGVRNLSRTNSLHIGIDDLIVGVLYGTHDDLSGHYLEIEAHHPVYTGKDFWHRLTGHEGFYLQLINAIGEVALEVDGRDKLEEATAALALDVAANF